MTLTSLTLNYIQQTVIFLVPAVEIIVASVFIWRSMKSAQVAPAVPSGMQPQISQPAPKQAQKALKMILLVSGSYWGTSIPATMLWLSAKNMVKSWEELDSRVNVTAFALMRSGSFLITIVSSFLNPLIFFWNRKDMRRYLLKMVGWKSVNPTFDNETTTTTT